MAILSLQFHALPFPLPTSSSSSYFDAIHLRSNNKNLVFIAYPLFSISSSSSRRRFATLVASASGDYYGTLGVSKSASAREIKASYRRLARQVRITFSNFFNAITVRKLFFCFAFSIILM